MAMLGKTSGRITLVAAALGVLILLVAAGGAVADTFTCTTATCNGTDERDVITGNRKAQTFNLYDGDDVAYGKRGADEVRGGWDDDVLLGKRGADLLTDRVDEGDYDEHFGGRGNDVIRADDGDERDSGDCGPGDDVLYVDGDDEADDFDNCEDVRGY
jgi:Ca2+-binding RTX toxin-like protein